MVGTYVNFVDCLRDILFNWNFYCVLNCHIVMFCVNYGRKAFKLSFPIIPWKDFNEGRIKILFLDLVFRKDLRLYGGLFFYYHR